MSDDPVDTLFAPFAAGAVEWLAGGRVLFLNGRHHPALPPAAAIQNFQFTGDERVRPEIPQGPFDVVLLHAPRQQDEQRYMIARALAALAPDGWLVCAAANDAGGRRLAGELAALGLTEVQSMSKHKARAVWARKTPDLLEDVAAQWLREGGWQPILDGRFVSKPGIFGWNRIDRGSALLAASIKPGSLAGTGADFGCGYGYLAAHIAAHHGVKKIICADVDHRAVEACRRNVAPKNGLSAEHIWCDFMRPQQALRGLDWVVMNPPFHEGKRAQPDIGVAFIENAASVLKTGGVLWMVANNHLPYEDTLAACFSDVKRAAQGEGFKVFHAGK